MRYVHGEFPSEATPTIGASFLQKKVVANDIELSLQMWDTAGQERFRSMAPMYYRGAKAALLVFDVTKYESFKRIGTYLESLQSHADPSCTLFLVGNKCDKEATFDLGQCSQMASETNATFITCSALNGENIDVLFEQLAEKVAENVIAKMNKNSTNANNVILDGENKGIMGNCCG